VRRPNWWYSGARYPMVPEHGRGHVALGGVHLAGEPEVRHVVPRSWSSMSTLAGFMSRWMMRGVQSWCRYLRPRADVQRNAAAAPPTAGRGCPWACPWPCSAPGPGCRLQGTHSQPAPETAAHIRDLPGYTEAAPPRADPHPTHAQHVRADSLRALTCTLLVLTGTVPNLCYTPGMGPNIAPGPGAHLERSCR